MFRFDQLRLLFAIPLIALSACAPSDSTPQAESPTGDSLSVVDDAGRTISLARPASRIISLLPGTTATLVELGATSALVGRTDYDDPSLDHLPSVGGGLTPSLEQIAALQPDLVIAWEEAGSARIRPRLEELSIPVFAAQTRDTAQIIANVERLGTLTGRRPRADSLAAEIRAGLAQVEADALQLDRRTVAYLVGIDPPFAAGPDLFIGQLVSLAGGDNIFPDLPSESAEVSVEAIVERRPQVVIVPVPNGGADPLDNLRGKPGWADLIASGETRVIALDADVMHQPGPSIVEAAQLLLDAIHSDSAQRD